MQIKSVLLILSSICAVIATPIFLQERQLTSLTDVTTVATDATTTVTDALTAVTDLGDLTGGGED